jgi:hypothetical protein
MTIEHFSKVFDWRESPGQHGHMHYEHSEEDDINRALSRECFPLVSHNPSSSERQYLYFDGKVLSKITSDVISLPSNRYERTVKIQNQPSDEPMSSDLDRLLTSKGFVKASPKTE